MKTIFTLLLSLCMTVAFAQDKMFVHTATVANTVSDVSYIDHADLNAKPGAKLLVTHNWNPGGGSGVLNDHTTGVFYDTSLNRWSVYNEDASPMILGSSYNVYIGGSSVLLHIATLDNQGAIDSYTIVDHPDLNGNPNAKVGITTYYNPNSLRNPYNYGVWYDDITSNRWIIYAEGSETIPIGAAFFVASQEEAVATTTHRSDSGNTSGEYTIIDHPLLNNNLNAVFIITHNWGVSGGSGNVVIDHVQGVYYTGTHWAIYLEDISNMPLNAEWDLFIFDPSLGTTDSVVEGLIYYPNPVREIITLDADEEITKVTVFDILGRDIMRQMGDGTSMQLDLSSLMSGNYLARVETANAVQVIKLIKL